ncbi:MAG: hypothetical protein JWP12_2909 [Bacteroidetes bacterium]|nr:hypothetical protein [Bacteroidota bacterium]
MLTVYCIPGMGVDARLFKNIKLNKAEIRHIKWLTPDKNESLASYAIRLSKQIDTSQSYALMGVSFGGMCAVEIAKHLHPVKTFVISSCKTSDQLPLKLTFWRSFSLYKNLSDSLYIKGALLVKKAFGVSSGEQAERFKEMLNAAPKNYFSGAVHCIMNWKNEIVPSSVIQIHGTSDHVLPVRKIKNANYIIERGTHFMIVNRAPELNAIMDKELELYL